MLHLRAQKVVILLLNPLDESPRCRQFRASGVLHVPDVLVLEPNVLVDVSQVVLVLHVRLRLHEDVDQHELNCLHLIIVVNTLKHCLASLEQLVNVPVASLWVTDLITNHMRCVNKLHWVYCYIHTNTGCIPHKVIILVNVQRISLVVDDVEGPSNVLVSTFPTIVRPLNEV